MGKLFGPRNLNKDASVQLLLLIKMTTIKITITKSIYFTVTVTTTVIIATVGRTNIILLVLLHQMKFI